VTVAVRPGLRGLLKAVRHRNGRTASVVRVTAHPLRVPRAVSPGLPTDRIGRTLISGLLRWGDGGGDEAGFVGEDDELGAVAGLEFGHGPTDVGFAVAWLITIRAAMSSLDSPRAANATTSRSRLVRLFNAAPWRPRGGRETYSLISLRVIAGHPL
jgi:hypothetical protein